MAINWYPGHMKKTMDLLKENIKLVDLIIELVDARIPSSSINPDFEKLTSNKEKIILLNKSDLADDSITLSWINYFNSKGIQCIKYNSSQNSSKVFQTFLNKSGSKIMKKYIDKGITGRKIKAMIIGIPNVGKSTFINQLSGKKTAKTGNRPGVTTGKQWIRINKQIDLLDTPGILWPKIEDMETGIKLAATGAIKDEIVNTWELTLFLINYIRINYPESIPQKYNIEINDKITNNEIINMIAKRNGCILKGNEIDDERICARILNDFRNGKLGKISLEKPE